MENVEKDELMYHVKTCKNVKRCNCKNEIINNDIYRSKRACINGPTCACMENNMKKDVKICSNSSILCLTNYKGNNLEKTCTNGNVCVICLEEFFYPPTDGYGYLPTPYCCGMNICSLCLDLELKGYCPLCERSSLKKFCISCNKDVFVNNAKVCKICIKIICNTCFDNKRHTCARTHIEYENSCNIL